MGRVTQPSDKASIKRSGQILSAALAEVVRAVKPGVSTAALDVIAEAAIQKAGGKPAFVGYNGYVATLCTSINDEVVHGIPSDKRILKDGDIIGLDLGVIVNGWYTDSAVTVPVGKISPEPKNLLLRTEASLKAATKAVKAGRTVGDIGAAVQASLKPYGYGIVRELVGHGIGQQLHEEPQVPNIGRPGTGTPLEAGMLLAIEPMVTLGKPGVSLDQDGWTFRTRDGSLAAHFEQTVLVTERGCEILTPYGETPWR